MLIETRNEADTVLTHVDARAAPGRRSCVDAGERAGIEAAVAALARGARRRGPRSHPRRAPPTLNRATEHLAEVMMDAALKGALGSGARTRSWSRSDGDCTR